MSPSKIFDTTFNESPTDDSPNNSPPESPNLLNDLTQPPEATDELELTAPESPPGWPHPLPNFVASRAEWGTIHRTSHCQPSSGRYKGHQPRVDGNSISQSPPNDTTKHKSCLTSPSIELMSTCTHSASQSKEGFGKDVGLSRVKIKKRFQAKSVLLTYSYLFPC